MGEFVNGKVLAGTAWLVAIVIMGLNGWLLLGMFREWIA